LNILNPAYARKTITTNQKIQEENIELLEVVSNEDEVGEEDVEDDEKMDEDEVVWDGGGGGVDSNIFILFLFPLFILFFIII